MLTDAVNLIKEITREKNSLFQVEKNQKYDLNSFKVKIPIFIETSKYIVKTAQNSDELIKSFELRFEVFQKEIMNKKLTFGYDIDKFDMLFDHLIVIDKKTGECAGTYRINSSAFNSKFYCENEFNIKDFLKLKGNKLELGRACINKNHRNGATLMMLWKGIFEYAKKTNTKYMFGCSSVYTANIFDAGFIHKYLKENHEFGIDCKIKPHSKYKLKKFGSFMKYLKNNMQAQYAIEAEILIPPLLNFYLKTGAKIAGEPAQDKSFNCIDFFTIIDLEKTNKSRGKRYGL